MEQHSFGRRVSQFDALVTHGTMLVVCEVAFQTRVQHASQVIMEGMLRVVTMLQVYNQIMYCTTVKHLTTPKAGSPHQSRQQR